MKKLIKYFFLAALTSLLLGCAGTVPSKSVDRINKVGIVSVVGDNLHTHEDGITKFGTYDNIVDISSWKINKLISTLLNNRLSKRFKTITIDRSDMNMVLWKDENNLDQKDNHIKTLMEEKGIDTVIVITKGLNPNWVANGALTVNRVKVILLPALQSGVILLEGYFYQNINGKIESTRSDLLIERQRLDETFWNEEEQTININKLDELENIFKNKLPSLIDKYLNENNL